MNINIRTAAARDLPAILDIMNHNILHSTAVYDYDIKTLQDLDTWLQEKQQGNWPVIVAEHEGKVIGYGTYGTFRIKVGYRFTVEHSVYVAEDSIGKGIGKMLLTELIRLAKEQGYHTMIGCIDAANDDSIAFHSRFGFEKSGVLKEVAYKFDRWLDLQLMQLILSD